MSTFKLGDKVCRIGDNCAGTVTGGIYTVKGFRMGGTTITLLEFPEDKLGWAASEFELAQEPVLTPEEVLKHLLAGTKMEYKLDSKWVSHSGDLNLLSVQSLSSLQWRIKPVPEIIEANGRKYKLIEE